MGSIGTSTSYIASHDQSLDIHAAQGIQTEAAAKFSSSTALLLRLCRRSKSCGLRLDCGADILSWNYSVLASVEDLESGCVVMYRGSDARQIRRALEKVAEQSLLLHQLHISKDSKAEKPGGN
jgi:hypothetical protein